MDEYEDGLISVSCELCGKSSYVYPVYPWGHRCWDCDPNREWFWERYQIWEAGITRGIVMARETDKYLRQLNEERFPENL